MRLTPSASVAFAQSPSTLVGPQSAALSGIRRRVAGTPYGGVRPWRCHPAGRRPMSHGGPEGLFHVVLTHQRPGFKAWVRTYTVAPAANVVCTPHTVWWARTLPGVAPQALRSVVGERVELRDLELLRSRCD